MTARSVDLLETAVGRRKNERNSKAITVIDRNGSIVDTTAVDVIIEDNNEKKKSSRFRDKGDSKQRSHAGAPIAGNRS